MEVESGFSKQHDWGRKGVEDTEHSECAEAAFLPKNEQTETGEEHPSPRERMDSLQILEFMSTWRPDKEPLIPGLSKQELDE